MSELKKYEREFGALTEEEMAEALSAWNSRGIMYLKEPDAFRRIMQAHSYILEQGARNCSQELLEAWQETERRNAVFVDSLSVLSADEEKNLREELSEHNRKSS